MNKRLRSLAGTFPICQSSGRIRKSFLKARFKHAFQDPFYRQFARRYSPISEEGEKVAKNREEAEGLQARANEKRKEKGFQGEEAHKRYRDHESWS